jgi:predicted naringenin-chalcone synthase
MMLSRAFLSVRSLPVGHRVPQADGVAWMQAALARAADAGAVDPDDAERARRFYDRLGRQPAIASRETCLADYTHQDWDAMTLHRPTSGGPFAGGTLDVRMAAFAETAHRVADAAFAPGEPAPDAILQVSCTGYDSPNAVQRVAAARGWMSARLLHLGHMGCYAAVPAVALAADLVAADALRSGADARASLLLVELCTLHHDPTTTDIERVVQQCLFADGAARLDVTAAPGAGTQFALLDHAEAILPDSLGAMTWRPADGGFRMTLARDVPQRIRAHVGGLAGPMLAAHGLTVDDVAVWAVHPGGPRVIEQTAEALALTDEQTRHSRDVLRARGNMSSTTLPHIWEAVAADDAVPAGALVASLAFGPGLTAVASLMRKVGNGG